MTMPGPIATRVRDLLDRLGLDVEGDQTDLFANGTLTSLTFVELLAELEDAFGITFHLPDLEPSNFSSVQAISRFVSRLVEAEAPQTSRSA